MDAWADYEGEVVRSEDIQFQQNYLEETIAPSQVSREKITIHEEEAPPEAPTMPPNREVPFGGLKNTERLANR